ncbi:MAG: HAMP domain-containing protein [Acidobacteria bacterium]|nr:HAMP domain-containing protein [Acidobacteriota bacterium]MBI3421936.1 HAMP domain-containing protein [Acidobacteriota bacterium]
MNTPATQTDEQLARRIQRRRTRIVVLAVITGLLFTLLFVQQAFDTLPWVRPDTASGTYILFALSTFNFLAFVVLLMVFVRNIIKLRREQQAGKSGARFKQRLVFYSVVLSLLPVTFMFFGAYGFLNRSLEKWFSLPADEMLSNALYIQSQYLKGEREGLERTAETISRMLLHAAPEQRFAILGKEAATQHLELGQLHDKDGQIIAQHGQLDPRQLSDKFRQTWLAARAKALQGARFSAELTESAAQGKATIHLVAAVPTEQGGAFVIAQPAEEDFANNINRIREVETTYEKLKSDKRAIRQTSMQTLLLLTLLVLFIAFWLALYVARGIADPVQQLAQATQHIRQGDLDYRASVVGDDELAALATSFNEMTAEMSSNRRTLEERRRYIETILQSLSAGVISLDEHSNITTINPAAQRLLHLDAPPESGVALGALLPEEQREELRRMTRRAARVNSVTREVHFTLANNAKLDAAITVTALHDPAGQTRGAVIVLEDLSELIEAQRRAAWSEVARRMAHEIKNPLTPIRLSADRLAKNLLLNADGTNGSNGSPSNLTERQSKLVRECTTLIGTEVETLQRMVDEFSTFARLPNAQLELSSLNVVVAGALKLYDERLDGVRLETRLASDLPSVWLDPEQLKRVLVNLIDNAAEAISSSNDAQHERRITVETRELADRDALELTVADTGPGIVPADRERIFDPYFSTRKRGTGLGLAIVSRIVAEHQGRIRVSENLPRGARFTLELPLNN